MQLIDNQGKILSLDKADIRRYDIGMKSDMPSFTGQLSPTALADLLSYLVSLKSGGDNN